MTSLPNADNREEPQSRTNFSFKGVMDGIKEVRCRGKRLLKVEESIFKKVLMAAVNGENFEASKKCPIDQLKYFLQTVKINQTNYEGIKTPLVQETMIVYIKSKLPEVSDWEFVPKVGDPLAIILTADITFPGNIEAVRTLVVSIKGTTNIHETIQDIRSLEIGSFHNSKGEMVGFSESGFIDHYDEIIGKETFHLRLKRMMCLGKSSSTYLNLADIVEKSKKFPGGLLIIGHSLGAAVANLMALDIATSYPGTPMHVVTFGCPRTFFSETADSVNAMEIKIDRIVNAGSKHYMMTVIFIYM
jgi:hypothetical protein